MPLPRTIVHTPFQRELFCSAQVGSILYRDFTIKEFASVMVLLNEFRPEKWPLGLGWLAH
jgi:hypothetical protein